MVAKLSFFALAGLFLLSAAFPLRSSHTGEWADFTFAVAFQDRPSGVYYDREFDWPTGEAIWVELPVWSVDAVLFVATGVAFGFYARRKLNEQKLAVGLGTRSN